MLSMSDVPVPVGAGLRPALPTRTVQRAGLNPAPAGVVIDRPTLEGIQ